MRNYETKVPQAVEPRPAPKPVAPVARRFTHWKAQEIETLERMLAEGKSRAQIARRLPGRTRNAVIGYLWRRQGKC